MMMPRGAFAVSTRMVFQISASTTAPRNDAGMTPITSTGCPSSWIERPTIAGSAAKRRCQSV